jgi:hypothetical protein
MIVLPGPAFIFTFLVLTAAAWLGTTRFQKLRAEVAATRDAFGVIQASTLTLLGLIISFTFSMALDRFEERKNFESAEASAIATAYMRADLLPPADAARLRSLLGSYLEQRLTFYETRSLRTLAETSLATAKIQELLWNAVAGPARASPNSITALAVASINDVVRSQGDTQASWSNRVPFTAWMMMGSIAFCAMLLVGIGIQRPARFPQLLAVLPLIISIAFFLIADVESPRLGMISVVPDNLRELSGTLQLH